MLKNVVFMGTPDFAVGTLQALLDSRYQVKAVFTQPDRPKNRGKVTKMTPVKEVAVAAGIPVHQPVRIREPENLELLKQYQPDVIVVVAFGQIIPKEILEYPQYGCINVHASLLPAYRGAAPIQWAVINGEKESGVTTMRMDTGLDTGDMILREVVPLQQDETGGSLFDKLSRTGAGLLIRTLEALEDGTAKFERQPEMSPTPYAGMLKKEMGLIDWSKSAKEIECLVRGLNPWPSAYTRYSGKTLKIWAADVQDNKIDEKVDAQKPVPGTIVEVTRQEILVQTGDGLLAVKELQLEGKKRMDTAAFLRGFPVEKGVVLNGHVC